MRKFLVYKNRDSMRNDNGIDIDSNSSIRRKNHQIDAESISISLSFLTGYFHKLINKFPQFAH